MKSISCIRVILLSTALSVIVTVSARADVVTHWNEVATTAAVQIAAGSAQSRVCAMAHVAIHDALNTIDRRYRPYAFHGRTDEDASPEAAVAAAAHDVLVHEIPIMQGFLDAAYADSLAGIANGPARDAGIALGKAAAAATLAARAADGSAVSAPYTPGSGPGVWIPTPPGFLPAGGTNWGNVTPFSLRSGDQFRLHRPAYFDLGSAAFAADYNEVKNIGDVNNPARTADESDIARFWYEASAQGWNRIARAASAQHDLDLWENARLFGLLNIAIADAYIAHFDTKYFYNFWRPVTAIRAGDTDGNDNTVADPDWLPYLVTPNIPDYPSGHSTAGAAAAVVLTRFFKHEAVGFRVTSAGPYPDITRSFASFADAAQENADARVLAGIHFRTATTDGLRLGARVGRFVFSHSLKPAGNN
jgi:hypothetical protein